MTKPPMPDYDAPIDPHEPDGPGSADDRYRADWGKSQMMLGLTLYEPWATAIARGVKTIETRDYPAPRDRLGSPLLITSAKRPLDWDAQLLAHQETFAGLDLPGGPLCSCGHDAQTCQLDKLSTFPFGHAVALTRLVGTVPADHVDFVPVTQKQPAHWIEIPDGGIIAPYFECRLGDLSTGAGRWGHLLGDVTALDPPRPIRGAQRYWHVKPADRNEILEQLT